MFIQHVRVITCSTFIVLTFSRACMPLKADWILRAASACSSLCTSVVMVSSWVTVVTTSCCCCSVSWVIVSVTVSSVNSSVFVGWNIYENGCDIVTVFICYVILPIFTRAAIYRGNS